MSKNKHRVGACSCQNKYGVMGKSKIKGSAMMDNVLDGLVTLGITGGSTILTSEAKAKGIPKLYKDGATDEDKKKVNLYVNLAGIGLGIASCFVPDKYGRQYVMPIGVGIGIQCSYALWQIYVNKQTTPTISGAWDAKGYAVAKAKAELLRMAKVKGPDNSSFGLMGPDNAAFGLMGKMGAAVPGFGVGAPVPGMFFAPVKGAGM